MARRFLSADASLFEQAQNITRSWDRLRVVKFGQLDANPTQIFGQNIVSRHEAIDIVMQVSSILRLFLFALTSFTKQRAGFLWPWKYSLFSKRTWIQGQRSAPPQLQHLFVLDDHHRNRWKNSSNSTVKFRSDVNGLQFWAKSGHILPYHVLIAPKLIELLL